MTAAHPSPSSKPEGGGRPVSDLHAHVGFWLRFVSNHVSSQFERRVEALGVSVSEWVALRQLYGNGGNSPADLMQSLGMTKGAISKILTRLEGKGLVARSPSSLDRRVQRLVLTRAGKNLVPKLAAVADQNDAHFFGHLPADRRRELIHAMQELVQRHALKALPTA